MINVYVLSSQIKKYRYVGITNDLPRRIRQHTRNKKYYAPFKVIFTKAFPGYPEAREEERFLKSGLGREFLDTLE